MKTSVRNIIAALILTMLLFSCKKNNNGPPPSIDGEYEGQSIITTMASQEEVTDSMILHVNENKYEYQGHTDLNDGSGYLLLTSDSVRFIDYRTTLFEHWDWILRGTYKYTLKDSVLTLFKQTETKTYVYDLKVIK